MKLDTFFSINEQLSAFFLAIPLGVFLGIVYDLFAIIRMLFPFLATKIPVIFEDIIFMLICGFSIFIFSFEFLRGDIRFYVIISAGIGFLLYYLSFGYFIRTIFRGTINFIVNTFKKITKREM